MTDRYSAATNLELRRLAEAASRAHARRTAILDQLAGIARSDPNKATLRAQLVSAERALAAAISAQRSAEAAARVGN